MKAFLLAAVAACSCAHASAQAPSLTAPDCYHLCDTEVKAFTAGSRLCKTREEVPSRIVPAMLTCPVDAAPEIARQTP